MSKIKVLLLFLPCMISLSCEDILIEKPKSIAVETFYNTPSELEAAIGAIYEAISHGDCMGGRYPAVIETMTDYIYGRGSHAPLSEFKGLDATNANRVYNIWNWFYRGIRNANLVIANAPSGEELSMDEISMFVGATKPCAK